MTWPNDVRGMDWTQPAMPGPPAERTMIGYWRWSFTLCDPDDPDYGHPCGRNYYVLPDGSAEIEGWDGKERFTRRLPPGTWRVLYPTWIQFGSRGGCFVEPVTMF